MGSLITALVLHVPCIWQLCCFFPIFFALNFLIEAIQYGVWKTSGKNVPHGWGTALGLLATAIWWVLSVLSSVYSGEGWSFGDFWMWGIWFVLGYMFQLLFFKRLSKMILNRIFHEDLCLHNHPEGEPCDPQAVYTNATAKARLKEAQKAEKIALKEAQKAQKAALKEKKSEGVIMTTSELDKILGREEEGAAKEGVAPIMA